MEIKGTHDQHFAPLVEAFRNNFTANGDVGAALTLVVDGEIAVDIWAGVADPESERKWEAGTRPNVWSTTKGVAATCFAMLAERGKIDYDAPVAEYWPEFAVHGKGEISVAMLLSHQAGLCGFRKPATIESYYTLDDSVAQLAAMEPFWLPGTQSGYHAITIGLLATKLFGMVEGRNIKQFVTEELGDLGISIGLDPALENERATMLAPVSMNSDAIVPDMSEAQLAALANPPLDPLIPNDPAWRAADIPSANGFATARGLARLYGALANDGCIDGKRLVSPSSLKAAKTERISGIDAILSVPARWGAGFLLNGDGIYGSSDRAFGHSGWGGSFAFADPDRRWGFAYVMNQMGTQLVGDPRNTSLLDAIYS